MTSLPLSLSPMTPHPHRCCCCYPLGDTMLQCEHPLSVSRPSGTEYDCMPRCHIFSCTPWCACRSACSISSSDARSPRVFHPCYFVPRCPLPRFSAPHHIHPSIGYYHLSAVNHLTRGRVHNYVLPSNTTTLDESNFMCRLMYKDCS